MSTRKIITWSIVIILGIVAAVLFGDLPIVVDNAAYAASAVLILSLIITGWRFKRRLKERMERGLGREVDDSELTSITTWMRIPNEAARAGREADKYDFDD